MEFLTWENEESTSFRFLTLTNFSLVSKFTNQKTFLALGVFLENIYRLFSKFTWHRDCSFQSRNLFMNKDLCVFNFKYEHVKICPWIILKTIFLVEELRVAPAQKCLIPSELQMNLEYFSSKSLDKCHIACCLFQLLQTKEKIEIFNMYEGKFPLKEVTLSLCFVLREVNETWKLQND